MPNVMAHPAVGEELDLDEIVAKFEEEGEDAEWSEGEGDDWGEDDDDLDDDDDWDDDDEWDEDEDEDWEGEDDDWGDDDEDA
jgi:hypothetical protein